MEVAKKYDANTSIELQRPFLRTPEGPESFVSPDFVIAFARARINQVNASLNRRLTTMQDGARDTDAVNKVLKEIAPYASGFDNGTMKEELKQKVRNLAETLPAGLLKDKLLAIANDANSDLNRGGDNLVTQGDLEALKKDLENTLKTIDRRCQDDQLYINKEMGERDQILQLAAMLIQSMNECIKQIQNRS